MGRVISKFLRDMFDYDAFLVKKGLMDAPLRALRTRAWTIIG